ncbi:MAG TPA: urease accessory protein UreD [Burkholderiales bacterium]|nr:urease accessory protein UreD [Burkholderiales bacterium]
MKPVEVLARRGWEAGLRLGFQKRGGRSVLASRASHGPLAIQKALYPEGGAVCHAILLHPPGGIAGGDRLAISIDVGPQAHALLTTPGATKWYRCAGEQASQRVDIAVRRDAVCEWLPQESIFFDGSMAHNAVNVELEQDAAFCGWDVMCLGRTARGERLASGRVRQHLRVAVDGRPLFEELGTIEGGGAALDSAAGLAGYPVCGTFVAAGIRADGDALAACRGVAAKGDGKWGVTAMEGIIVARCLAHSAEAARGYFLGLWEHLRPRYARMPCRAPRIWAT